MRRERGENEERERREEERKKRKENKEKRQLELDMKPHTCDIIPLHEVLSHIPSEHELEPQRNEEPKKRRK